MTSGERRDPYVQLPAHRLDFEFKGRLLFCPIVIPIFKHHHFLTVTWILEQVADVSKKGWTDLSGLFGKSVSLYEDPNERDDEQRNGLSNSNSYTDYSSGSAGGYQQQTHRQHDSNSGSAFRQTSSGETNSLLNSSSSSTPSASPSSSKSKGRSRPAAVPAVTTTTSTGVSREEKTLLDLESEFNPGKGRKAKSGAKATLEDEFWAELEK